MHIVFKTRMTHSWCDRYCLRGISHAVRNPEHCMSGLLPRDGDDSLPHKERNSAAHRGLPLPQPGTVWKRGSVCNLRNHLRPFVEERPADGVSVARINSEDEKEKERHRHHWAHAVHTADMPDDCHHDAGIVLDDKQQETLDHDGL